jgi:FkbM family methyltransferase
MLDWAALQHAPVLLINSDLELHLADWELKRLRWLAADGLGYLVRYNHDGNPSEAVREAYGIDAFLLHGRDASLFGPSCLSVGEPFWDYWLPHVFLQHHRPVLAAEFPVAFHQRHAQRWSWASWHTCALEYARLMAEPAGDRSLQACLAMAGRVRQRVERGKRSLSQSPFPIRAWVERTFAAGGPKTFLELGSHTGTDTDWMARIPGVTIHAFEPDPRNHQPPRDNVIIHRAAVADRDGRGVLILSQEGWGQPWTHSSSIKHPKHHLQRYPVTFGDAVAVDLITLDTFCQQQALGAIDFIWADIQGAEGEMIRGGPGALARTRYLYTEYSDDELYEQQATLSDILRLLPNFRVLELWPDEVLLENRDLC